MKTRVSIFFKAAIGLFIVLLACCKEHDQSKLPESWLNLPASSGVRINEFVAASWEGEVDPVFGAIEDWIELYNSGDEVVDLSGYTLTDDHREPTKWRFPAGTSIAANAYSIVWGGTRKWVPGDTLQYIQYPQAPKSKVTIPITTFHLNFKLNRDSGIVALLRPDGFPQDVVQYGKQLTDVSYALNDQCEWEYQSLPTLGLKNDTAGVNWPVRSDAPRINKPGGFYDQAFDLPIKSPPLAEVYYTLDGSTPTARSLKYQGSLHIDSTVVFRAISMSPTKLPSEVVTATYFVNVRHDLPILSIAVPPYYLWNDTVGIYVEGKNGCPNLNGHVANYNQDWERPATFSYFLGGEQEFDQLVGIKVNGTLHQRLPVKSLSIHARGSYGSSRLNYPFFNNKAVKEFKSLVLRNSGNDVYNTMFRDGLVHTLVAGQMDIDYLAYQPVVVYLNGRYWGVQNLREKVTAEYCASNHGLDADKIVMVKTFREPITVEGDTNAYDLLMTRIRSLDMTDSPSYDRLNEWIDVDEFINYLIVEIYTGNQDWPANNTRMWTHQGDSARWRWTLVDMDMTWGLRSEYNFNAFDWLADTTAHGWNRKWSTEIYRRAIQNEPFKTKFIDQFAHHLNSTFHPDRVLGIIDSLYSRLLPEMDDHWRRWGGGMSMSRWKENVNIMQVYAINRPAFIRHYLMYQFGLSEESSFAKATAQYALTQQQSTLVGYSSRAEDWVSVPK